MNESFSTTAASATQLSRGADGDFYPIVPPFPSRWGAKSEASSTGVELFRVFLGDSSDPTTPRQSEGRPSSDAPPQQGEGQPSAGGSYPEVEDICDYSAWENLEMDCVSAGTYEPEPPEEDETMLPWVSITSDTYNAILYSEWHSAFLTRLLRQDRSALFGSEEALSFEFTRGECRNGQKMKQCPGI